MTGDNDFLSKRLTQIDHCVLSILSDKNVVIILPGSRLFNKVSGAFLFHNFIEALRENSTIFSLSINHFNYHN